MLILYRPVICLLFTGAEGDYIIPCNLRLVSLLHVNTRYTLPSSFYLERGKEAASSSTFSLAQSEEAAAAALKSIGMSAHQILINVGSVLCPSLSPRSISRY